jgi:hypothetical protein
MSAADRLELKKEQKEEAVSAPIITTRASWTRIRYHKLRKFGKAS